MYTQRILTDCVKACKTFQADEHCIPYGFNQPHPTISLQKLPSLISLNKWLVYCVAVELMHRWK